MSKSLNVDIGTITADNVEQVRLRRLVIVVNSNCYYTCAHHIRYINHQLNLNYIAHQLKKINQACLPIAYAPSFYTDLVAKNSKDGTPLEVRQNLNKFAYWNGFAVGAICCKIEGIKDR